jgi:hypothetical protein
MAVNFEHALNCKSRNIEDFYLSSNQAYGLDEPVNCAYQAHGVSGFGNQPFGIGLDLGLLPI